MELEWAYEGVVNDPPRQSRHLRFVTPSETAGHIGEEGAYLSGETHWYPEMSGSLPTFMVEATVPESWMVVTHGREVSMSSSEKGVTSVWEVTAPTDALTLVANRFVKQHREWRGIEMATYFFPQDAGLAGVYLEATQRYLEVYTDLLGPYPYPKFAVVENFFPGGLGLPSFTLLGNRVIKRRYIQPYALGHEIVHCWIGNSVFNDVEQGNWVEGLTTYLSNYYYEELTGTADQARHQRRRMVLAYSVYVWPEEDYPVGAFRHKTDQKDNAIGYQKAAMVFHMLRSEIGERAFWKGIRSLIADHSGAYATWQDLEEEFNGASGKDLRWFFAQWVERAGAPQPTVVEAAASRASTEGGHLGAYRISGLCRPCSICSSPTARARSCCLRAARPLSGARMKNSRNTSHRAHRGGQSSRL